MSKKTYTIKDGKLVEVKPKGIPDRAVVAGDTLHTGPSTPQYRKNFDKIFRGKKKHAS